MSADPRSGADEAPGAAPPAARPALPEPSGGALARLAARALIAAAAALALACLLSPLLTLAAGVDPFDPGQASIADALLPPAWLEGGRADFPLGADEAGRGLVLAILHGGRLTILTALGAVAIAVTLGVLVGVAAGMAAGTRAGWLDAALMRLAEVQATLPGLLAAILVNGLARALLPPDLRETLALPAAALAIGLSEWPAFARLARAAARIEARRDFVAAARLSGVSWPRILTRHVLPGALRAPLALAVAVLPQAAIAEATLSFLGLGAPPDMPSLGALVRAGSAHMLSGAWWTVAFPSAALVLLTLGAGLAADALAARREARRG